MIQNEVLHEKTRHEPTQMINLSKSRIMSSLQCVKRVHLEINHKELSQPK